MSEEHRKKVLIVGQMASFAGAGPLAQVFGRMDGWDVDLVAAQPDNLGFSRLYNAHVLGKMGWLARLGLRKSLQDPDLTIIAGTPGLDTWMRLMTASWRSKSSNPDTALRMARKFSRRSFSKPVALLVTDSHLLRNPDEVNALIALFPDMRIFAMPDLIPFIGRDGVLPFYPGTGVPEVSEARPSRARPLIGHSPSRESRFEQKGTRRILDVLQAHGLDHDLISGLPYDEALRRKSQLDIFVDQVAPSDLFPKAAWSGGVGKSGLEAMALGCAVVTSGVLAETEPHMPLPPVLMTNEDRFESDLLDLVRDPERIARMGRDGKAWFVRYATPEAQVRFILEQTAA